MKDNNQKNIILKKRADLLRIPETKNKISGTQFQCLEFLLLNEKYALESAFILEVVPLNGLTPLPCTPAFILGIVNVRGKILSVLDIKKFLNLPSSVITKLNKVIIVKHQDIELGILVDEIIGNTSIGAHNLQEKIVGISDTQDHFIRGITPEGLIVLNIEKLLSDKKIIIDEEA